jgi:membrane protease subunit HflK
MSNAPPSFSDFADQFQPTLRKMGWILPVAAILILLGSLGTCIYSVSTESIGVLQRFGKFIGVAEPGLRFKLPWGIDQVTMIPVKRQLKLEFGFGTGGSTNPLQSSDEQKEESDMVTGDLNAARVEWVVQYEVSDPTKYLFKHEEPTATLRDLSEAVMREVVGDRTVDEVLTYGRQGIEVDAIAKLTTLVNELDMGLRVQQVQLKSVHPPAAVQESFDEVNRAQQEREQLINQANGEYNRVIPRAAGEADRKIQEAEGYSVKRTNEAEGDVARFKALLEQYRKAPEVTRRRLYLEALGEVIPNLGGKVILDSDAKQLLPLLQLPSPTPTEDDKKEANPERTRSIRSSVVPALIPRNP